MDGQDLETRRADVPAPVGGSLVAMPVMSLAQAIERHNYLRQLVRESLWEDGTDSGVIPGTDKPTLLKPGAEKLCAFFGLAPKFVPENIIEDWTGEKTNGEPLFAYRYTCELWRGYHMVASATGSANSWEGRYRWRWVREEELPDHLRGKPLVRKDGRIAEYQFAIEKREATGKYGKPAAYWDRFEQAMATGQYTSRMQATRSGREYPMIEIGADLYRIPNDDVFTLVNTVSKIAQKRALIAAVLIAVGASGFFTQDLEDIADSLPDREIAGTATVVTPGNGAPQATTESKARPAATKAKATAPAKPAGPTAPWVTDPAQVAAYEATLLRMRKRILGDTPGAAELVQACQDMILEGGALNEYGGTMGDLLSKMEGELKSYVAQSKADKDEGIEEIEV